MILLPWVEQVGNIQKGVVKHVEYRYDFDRVSIVRGGTDSSRTGPSENR